MIVNKGDIWILGNHKLLCENALNMDNYSLLLKNELADFVFTDPPYGIKITQWDKAIDIKEFIFLIDYFSKSDSFFAFTHQMPLMLDWLNILNKSAYKYKDHIIWVKRIATAIAQDIMRSHESLMIYKKGKPEYFKTKGKYSDVKVPGLTYEISTIDSIQRHISDLNLCIKTGERRVNKASKGHPSYNYMSIKGVLSAEEVNFTNVWSFLPHQVANKNNKINHPTVKPILLMERIIELCSNNNAIVLDPFLGSGSTLIACENINRKCYGMEINPQYCEEIINRWEKLTKQKAININESKVADASS